MKKSKKNKKECFKKSTKYKKINKVNKSILKISLMRTTISYKKSTKSLNSTQGGSTTQKIISKKQMKIFQTQKTLQMKIKFKTVNNKFCKRKTWMNKFIKCSIK